MLSVQIFYNQGLVVLQARSSEILIIPQHVSELQKTNDLNSFREYFMSEALVNRPARKLFQAWLKKDSSLWNRLFACVHDNKENDSTLNNDDQKNSNLTSQGQ